MIIRINNIKIKENRRQLDTEKVDQLAESIKEIGLINPITLDSEFNLIAGLHRIEAYKLLEKTKIESTILDIKELDAELAEIDENLIRNELRWNEQIKQLKRRKEIYEIKYPESKQYSSEKQSIKRSKSDIKPADIMSAGSFTGDTSEKTGKTERTIRRDLQLANAIEENPDYEKLEHKSDVFKEIKKEKRNKEIEKQKKEITEDKTEVKGLYDVISIDPPWNYGRKYDPDNSRVANPYPEMTIEEIKNIKLPFKDNAIIFLWTTHKYLPDAFELLKHWGLDYKATLVWNKNKIGMGHWFRMQCEFCLFGIKGKPFWSNTTERDIIIESRREHSRKPEAFFKMVDKICVGKKLEYFSREKKEGWDIYGNDTNKF